MGRLWKARASEKVGIMRDRERVALQYTEKLKEKYGQHPQISRIARHRQVPRHVKSARAQNQAIKDGAKRKEANKRKHSKPGSVPYVSERESHYRRDGVMIVYQCLPSVLSYSFLARNLS